MRATPFSIARIGEITEKVDNWNPSRDANGNEIEYIDLTAVNNQTKLIENCKRIEAKTAPSRARQRVKRHDIIISTVRPNLNGVALVTDELDGATASTGFCVLRPITEKVHVEYLFHWVRNPIFVADMVSKATGQSYPAVSDKIILDSEIPLPPLAEQQRIATILQKADSLRRLRQRAIDRLNTLGQAIFREMFGDPVNNPLGWNDEHTLGAVADIVSGITKGRKLNGQRTRTIPYLAVANVQERELRLSGVKVIEATEDEIQRYRLRINDLLLTEGGDPDKLGRGTLWNGEIPECIHQNHVFRVRLNGDTIEPVFLNWLMGSERGKKYFLRSAKQTTGIASINMTQLRGFPLLIPPLNLQRDFCRRLAMIEKQKATSIAALESTAALFASLQHRAFRGAL
jgi:type I restriction enzyme S subunit